MVKLLLPSAPHWGFSQERGTPSAHIQTDFVGLNLSHTPRTPSQQSFGSVQTQSHAQARRQLCHPQPPGNSWHCSRDAPLGNPLRETA